MKRLRTAVVGVGHLGKEHARILSTLPEVELVGVADVVADQAQAVASRCGTRAFTDFQSLVSQVDAAVIAVPTAHHVTAAAAFLKRGLAVLVEKPLAADLRQAEELVELARREHALLQVGHIERFNPAFEEITRRTFVPRFLDAERLGGFTGRSTDIGVVLDLMIHDLDLILTLVRAPVRTVEAVGVSVFGGHEDVADARLTFTNGCVAHLRASRASYAASRRMNIWSAEGFIAADWGQRHVTLVQPSVHVRRHGLDVRQLDPEARARLREDLFGQHLEVLELNRHSGDPLTLELQSFVHAARHGTRPRVSGEDGLAAIALATEILAKLKQHAWTGDPSGPCGPMQLPLPLAQLFSDCLEPAA